MADQSTSPSTAIERVRASVLELIREEGHEGFNGLGPTDVRNLADSVSTAVVRRFAEEQQIEAALTVTTTVGELKRATVGGIVRWIDAGFRPMQVHNLYLFAEGVKIPLEFARDWLKKFDISLSDSDAIENAIYSTLDIVAGYKKRATSDVEKAFDRNADVTLILTAIMEIADQRVLTDLDSLESLYF